MEGCPSRTSAEAEGCAPVSQTPVYDALEPRHQRFVDELLVSPNATRAYTAAYGTEGQAATTGASRLLTNANVVNALAEKRAILAARTEVTAERVLREMAKVAFSSMRTFATWGPDGVALIDDATLTDDDARCVLEVGETRTKDGGSVRIKLHDKMGALKELAELIGITPEMVKKTFPDLNDEARRTRVLTLLKGAKERKAAGEGR